MLRNTPSGGLTIRLAESQEQRDAEELMAWLALQGLTPQQATRLLSTSGVHSLHGLALFFRFELPPLWLANTESVRDHMRVLCGIGGQRALRMLSELGVAGMYLRCLVNASPVSQPIIRFGLELRLGCLACSCQLSAAMRLVAYATVQPDSASCVPVQASLMSTPAKQRRPKTLACRSPQRTLSPQRCTSHHCLPQHYL